MVGKIASAAALADVCLYACLTIFLPQENLCLRAEAIFAHQLFCFQFAHLPPTLICTMPRRSAFESFRAERAASTEEVPVDQMEVDPEAPDPALAGVSSEIEPGASDVVPAPMDIPAGVLFFAMTTGNSDECAGPEPSHMLRYRLRYLKQSLLQS